MRLRRFLLVTAIGEGVTGLGLLLFPAVVLSLLLGLPPASDIVFISRITGTAVLVIAIISGLASHDGGSAALSGILVGLLVYDVIIAALLAYAGGVMGMSGPLLWPVVVAHMLLAAWCVGSLRDLARIAPVWW